MDPEFAGNTAQVWMDGLWKDKLLHFITLYAWDQRVEATVVAWCNDEHIIIDMQYVLKEWIEAEFYTLATFASFFFVNSECNIPIQYTRKQLRCFAALMSVNWNEIFSKQILGNFSTQCLSPPEIALVHSLCCQHEWVLSILWLQHTNKTPGPAKAKYRLDISSENTASKLASIWTSLNTQHGRISQVVRTIFVLSTYMLHIYTRHIHSFITWHQAKPFPFESNANTNISAQKHSPCVPNWWAPGKHTHTVGRERVRVEPVRQI